MSIKLEYTPNGRNMPYYSVTNEKGAIEDNGNNVIILKTSELNNTGAYNYGVAFGADYHTPGDESVIRNYPIFRWLRSSSYFNSSNADAQSLFSLGGPSLNIFKNSNFTTTNINMGRGGYGWGAYSGTVLVIPMSFWNSFGLFFLPNNDNITDKYGHKYKFCTNLVDLTNLLDEDNYSILAYSPSDSITQIVSPYTNTKMVGMYYTNEFKLYFSGKFTSWQSFNTTSTMPTNTGMWALYAMGSNNSGLLDKIQISNGIITWSPAPVPVSHTVTINSGTGGSATISPQSPVNEGVSVGINITPDDGYKTGSITITANDENVPFNKLTDNSYAFTMPTADVVINVSFVSDDPYNPGVVYTITKEQSNYGNVIAPSSGNQGNTINVTMQPNLGQKVNRNTTYVLMGLNSIAKTWIDDTHFTFIMPAGNVIIRQGYISNDAYVPAGEDAEDLGGGDYSDISDPVPVPSVPSISASNIGMVTLFRPSLQNILDLGQYLYTDWWELGDNLKKWLSNPIEAMIGFNIVPCIPAVGTDRVVKLGIVSTGVSMPPVNSQWYDFDCGTIDITPYTGTMLDYAPNTKIQIMLPFIGSSALDTDEVMNRTLGLKYRIDLLSGACVAMLTINGDVHYQWTGECAVNIPFSASDFSRVYGAVLGAVGAGVTGFMAAGAAGVASQAGAQAAIASATRNNIAASKAFDKAIGDVVKGSRGAPALRQQLKEASSNAMQKAISEAGNAGNIAGSIKAAQIARTVNNVVGQVMSAKGGVAHSGTISGAAGMLGVRTPYVIIEYPNQSLPENYRHFVGYPSNITARLGDLTGYTECEQLIANGITGTDSEYTELVEALKGGVYL